MILLIFIQLFIVLSNQFNLDGIRHNCLTEWKFEENFTFIEMYEKNITSEELYHWSAPLDIIEHYQFYLDQVQLHTINLSSIETQLYYNCTLSRFGSRCEYELVCDEKVDCLNDAVDEKYCWQLYINECEENEFRCYLPEYICYNQSLCNGFYPTNELLFLNHSTCRRPKDFPVTFDDTSSLTISDYLIMQQYYSRHSHNVTQ
ncbi:hypothetical protein I4U23_012341 [Adineta vaga]|nr:hypothetical protein I4U23_012341 [Adineta vaga]